MNALHNLEGYCRGKFKSEILLPSVTPPGLPKPVLDKAHKRIVRR